MTISAQAFPIREVFIYKGHVHNSALGPYLSNVYTTTKLFQEMNTYREQKGFVSWKVQEVEGEALRQRLKASPKTSLLVIPAGPSSQLDEVFSEEDLQDLTHFFYEGGRGYVVCGSAYWVSKTRNYACSKKLSRIPLFEGTAFGPFYPFTGSKYRVDFSSKTVRVIMQTGGFCKAFLSGGGSFILPEKEQQRVKVLTQYEQKDLRQSSIASIMAKVGEGALVLSMYHLEYGPEDIDPELDSLATSYSGTNWNEVRNNLSPSKTRLPFFEESVISPLETLGFEEKG